MAHHLVCWWFVSAGETIQTYTRARGSDRVAGPDRRELGGRPSTLFEALSLGRPVVKNVVALGALQESTAILTGDSILNAVREALADKCAMIPMNEEAFEWGARSVREGFTHLPEA